MCVCVCLCACVYIYLFICVCLHVYYTLCRHMPVCRTGAYVQCTLYMCK